MTEAWSLGDLLNLLMTLPDQVEVPEHVEMFALVEAPFFCDKFHFHAASMADHSAATLASIFWSSSLAMTFAASETLVFCPYQGTFTLWLLEHPFSGAHPCSGALPCLTPLRPLRRPISASWVSPYFFAGRFSLWPIHYLLLSYFPVVSGDECSSPATFHI